jgi:hypothetical protein
MKNQIKAIGLSVIVFMINGLLNNVSAHQIINSLSTSASATDWFTVVCPIGTAEFYGDILDISSADGALLTLTLSKSGAVSSTDNPEGGALSPGVTLVNSAGLYNIFVRRTKATTNPTNYYVNIHCQSASHSHTPTQPNPIIKQNQ